MVATVLDLLLTVSVNQTVFLSGTAAMTSTVYAVSALIRLVDAELNRPWIILIETRLSSRQI
jgi:methanogenic corrinoid protein MtbC1